MIVAGGIDSLRLNAMNHSMDNLYNKRIIPILNISDIKENAYNIRLTSVKLLTNKNTMDIDQAEEEIEALREKNNMLLEEYSSTSLTKEESALLDEFKLKISVYGLAQENYFNELKEQNLEGAVTEFTNISAAEEATRNVLSIENILS